MKAERRVKVWLIAGVAGAAALFAGVELSRPKEVKTLTGVVLRFNQDPGKQLPIADAQITAEGGNPGLNARTASGPSGLFTIKLKPGIRVGEMFTLGFRHPDYRPMSITEYAQDRLYVIRMIPSTRNAATAAGETSVIRNVRVRYATETTAKVNVGSAAKTFEVVNQGDIACQKNPVCSPDGKWRATVGGASLDAGEGNEFEDARVSCIAGPCPFTKIEKDGFSHGGQHISVTVRDWSDPVSFVFEAEVTRVSRNLISVQAFPVVFGQTMSFTVPQGAEGLTIQAELNGMEIIYPLGPDLILSWANCTAERDAGGSNLYQCVIKPGYRFG